jgi:hypothetical protein
MSSITSHLRLRRAFEGALRREYVGPLGDLMAAAVAYTMQRPVDRSQLRTMVDADSAAVLSALFRRTASGSTMTQIRAAMIGNALLNDKVAVVQWAKEGLTRCGRAGGRWPATEREWQWVISHPDSYMRHLLELQRFFHQG